MAHLLSAALWSWLYLALVFALVVIALFCKREAASALGWSLAIFFLGKRRKTEEVTREFEKNEKTELIRSERTVGQHLGNVGDRVPR